MVTYNNLDKGIFTVDNSGKVKVDFLYDGGWYQGELAVFSLTGMENYQIGSQAFIQEAARRALTNSDLGYVAVKDVTDRARFSGKVSWEPDFNSGEYQGDKTLLMQAGDKFAMMLAPKTVAQLQANPNDTTNKPVFSFGTINPQTGAILAQMVDVTGNNHTFGWEDVSLLQSGDKDYNDLVIQVAGAQTDAALMDREVNPSRDWRNTQIGQELVAYASRPLFEKGTFQVNATGQVKIDYLFDGGYFTGEVAMFSLEGMDAYQPGSQSFIQEAAKRAISNSEQGRIVIRDTMEGARFTGQLPWKPNFNAQVYQGVKEFNMKAGDRVAFMMVQNGKLLELANNPSIINQYGKLPLFSVPDLNPAGKTTPQMVAIDNKGTVGFEDISIDSGKADRDYNDLVFQMQGLTGGDLDTANSKINSLRDWRTTQTGQELLQYAGKPQYSAGAFEVGETGKVQFDFLFDGGWYQSELAIFSLAGMENFTPGSDAFVKEAARRALTNSNQGYVVLKDKTEGARFTKQLSWEPNFNAGNYLGAKTFNMNAGDEFGFMLVQNTTVTEMFWSPTNSKISGKRAIFSIPEANPGGSPISQMVAVDNNGSYAFEDLRVDLDNSDRDYNDVVFQIKGAHSAVQSMDRAFNKERDWRTTDVGKELLEYSARPVFDSGVFVVGNSGEVSIDFLYDGGLFLDEVGIFSLNGMEGYEVGSQAFIDEAIRRALSDSNLGHVVVKDVDEAARFDYTDDIIWEKAHNSGIYDGPQIFNMNAGDTFGIIVMPNGAIGDPLIAPTKPTDKQIYFSMNQANLNDSVQVAQALSNQSGSIIGMEDVHLDADSNRDYNDIVLAIEGAQAVGFSPINDVIREDHNWQNTMVGEEILTYL